MLYVSLYRSSSPLSSKGTKRRLVRMGVYSDTQQEAEKIVINAFEGEKVKFRRQAYNEKTYCYIEDECVGCISKARDSM